MTDPKYTLPPGIRRSLPERRQLPLRYIEVTMSQAVWSHLLFRYLIIWERCRENGLRFHDYEIMAEDCATVTVRVIGRPIEPTA